MNDRLPANGQLRLDGPFRVLGLAPGRELTDDDVRAAWRRVAAATHPDRPDGGDPAAFAAAAAAYTTLRTPSGRGEALADLAQAGGGNPQAGPVPDPRGRLRLVLTAPAGRIRRGRPGRLLARLGAATATAVLAVAAVGWQPASVALSTGALTWLVLTGRGELAPPRRRPR